jgi:hypothetical protein
MFSWGEDRQNISIVRYIFGFKSNWKYVVWSWKGRAKQEGPTTQSSPTWKCTSSGMGLRLPQRNHSKLYKLNEINVSCFYMRFWRSCFLFTDVNL